MAPDEKIETIDAFNRIPIIIESVFHISCSIIRLKKNNSEYEKNFLGEIGIFLFAVIEKEEENERFGDVPGATCDMR